jgi:CrcB protein
MSWSVVGWIALGGALGAILRAAVAVWLAAAAVRGEFPWATLLVNLTGTAIFALLAAFALSGRPFTEDVLALVGTGLCGALTTFSTFAVELVLLFRAGAFGTGIAYAVASLVGSLVIVLLVFRLVSGLAVR